MNVRDSQTHLTVDETVSLKICALYVRVCSCCVYAYLCVYVSVYMHLLCMYMCVYVYM